MSFLNINIPSLTSETVSIIDSESLDPVFVEAKKMKVSSNTEIYYPRNPIETGGTITDHKVVLPDIVSVSCIINDFNYRSVVQEIRDSAIASRVFTVQTKSITYDDMVIDKIPVEEDPSMFDSVTIVISFSKIQFDEAEVNKLTQGKVSNKPDSSTVDRGEQSTTGTQSSIAARALRGIGVF